MKISSWENLSDEALLEMRICDLNLEITESGLMGWVETLYQNLADKNLSFKPDCYLADEWFVMEDKTSIGIPFFLAHPRLKALEQKMMLEVEGGSKEEFLKLLRHEAGHAFFYAYRFGENRQVKKLFGPSPENPPESYRPKPYSKSFVRHLDNWYAQSEPDEDFAETFAVWLTPELNWREYYRGWPVLEKLECMHTLMEGVAGKPPPKPSKDRSCSAQRSKLKLKVYYARKQKLFAQDYPDYYDRDLKTIFSAEESWTSGELARDFLRRHRRMIVDKVARWSGEKKFIVNNLFKKLMERSQQLKMRVKKDEEESLLDISAYLTSMVTHYLYTGKFKPTV